MLKVNFLREEKEGIKDTIKYVGNEMKIYVPSYFFDDTGKVSLASINGQYTTTIGILWFTESGKNYKFILPVSMEFSYSEKETVKAYKLTPEIPAEDYTVFTLRNGDYFLTDKKHRRDVEDIITFMHKFFQGGKIPCFISYSEALTLVEKMMFVSNKDLGVPLLTIEFLLSQIYRDRKNMSSDFRFAYNGKNGYDGKPVRITKVPQLISTFSSIIGEDTNNQLISSVIRSRTHAKEPYTPFEEKVIY